MEIRGFEGIEKKKKVKDLFVALRLNGSYKNRNRNNQLILLKTNYSPCNEWNCCMWVLLIEINRGVYGFPRSKVSSDCIQFRIYYTVLIHFEQKQLVLYVKVQGAVLLNASYSR